MVNFEQRILVVDDINTINKMLRPVLMRELGFRAENILEASNGRVVLDILGRKKVDLLLCEWDIPEINGLELLKHLRSSSHFSTIPFIMVTSRSDQTDILRAVQAQVTQYIVKPFTVDHFCNKLREVLRSKSQRVHERRNIVSENEMSVLVNGHPLSSGKIINISKGGALASLLVHRGITIYSRYELQISYCPNGSQKQEKYLVGEVVRIEGIRPAADKSRAYYAFMFVDTNADHKKFLEEMVKSIEDNALEVEKDREKS